MYKEIAIKKIVPSPQNYRKVFNEAAMKELIESIKKKGIIEPIIVRPVKVKGKDMTEIVAGHRRWKAAVAAGLKEIPAIERKLTDEEALEIQIIENNQRQDPNPMEEAWGFEKLLAISAKYTPQILAAKVDRSLPYITSRLKFLELDETVQLKISSGELPLGHAMLFTRIQDQETQKEFLKVISRNNGVTFKEAQQILKQNYSLSLKEAEFDTDTCASCPSRSRNQTVLFPDLKKTDDCTDKKCYAGKTEKHYTDMLAGKEKAGFKVFTNVNKKEAYKIAAPDAEDVYWDAQQPKKYKTKCLKCKERGYYLLKEKMYGNEIVPSFEFGELCLDKECLDKMNNTAPSHQVTKSPVTSHQSNTPGRCIERFAAKKLAQHLSVDTAFQQRFLLCSLLQHNAQQSEEELCDKVWNSTPEDFTRLLIASAEEIFSTEFGISLLIDYAQREKLPILESFQIDREYLETKKGEGLKELIAELNLKIDTSSDDAEIREAILAQDLTGKVPEEIKKVLAGEDSNI